MGYDDSVDNCNKRSCPGRDIWFFIEGQANRNGGLY